LTHETSRSTPKMSSNSISSCRQVMSSLKVIKHKKGKNSKVSVILSIISTLDRYFRIKITAPVRAMPKPAISSISVSMIIAITETFRMNRILLTRGKRILMRIQLNNHQHPQKNNKERLWIQCHLFHDLIHSRMRMP